VSGRQKTPFIGAYIPLYTLDHLPGLEEAINRFLGRDSIVIGYLNADMGRLQNPQITGVLVDLLSHFRQRPCFCHLKTWWKVQQGRLLRSWCNYVLGLDRQLFETVKIRYPSNFAPHHFLLRLRLLQRQTRCHGGYLRGHQAFPLALPPMVPLNLVGTKF